VKVIVLNADAGQSDFMNGKAHALGLGWTTIQAPTITPIAVVVIMQFDNLDEAIGAHKAALLLLDEDRQPVVTNNGAGQGQISVEVELTVGRAVDGAFDGPVSATFVVNIGPGIPLEPKRRYYWQASVDGRSSEDWSSSFVTHSPSSGPSVAPQLSSVTITQP
jgi:hypothetical protein